MSASDPLLLAADLLADPDDLALDEWPLDRLDAEIEKLAIELDNESDAVAWLRRERA